MSKAIAVVEDDESIREMLRYYFQSVGYAVRAYESGEALFAGEEGLGLPALYILDIMLPGMDGLEILRRLREGRDTADVPVIMLTARSAEMDRVAGLENGADDYVVKPFGIMELQARVKAVLRRFQPDKNGADKPKGKIVEYPDLIVNQTNYSVIYRGKTVDMPPKELELLYFLAASPNQVFTREQLLDHIWGYEYMGDTRTVDVHIKRLREKIKDHEDWAISTVWGIGYKFEVKHP